jgi:hypothetical protein
MKAEHPAEFCVAC